MEQPKETPRHQAYSDAARVDNHVRGYHYVHIRTKDLYERLRREAEQTGRSVSGTLEMR